MTVTDEEWFAERERLERARGRCSLALLLGVPALAGALFSAVVTVVSVATAAFQDRPEGDIYGGLVLCAVFGALGLFSARTAARAYGAAGWARWLCGLPGGLAAAVAAAFVGAFVLLA